MDMHQKTANTISETPTVNEPLSMFLVCLKDMDFSRGLNMIPNPMSIVIIDRLTIQNIDCTLAHIV